MEGKTDDLSDKTIRRIVKKDSDSRLRTELLGCQSILTQIEIDSLPRATLVGYVTLLRQLNKAPTSCRNKITDFDPKNSKIMESDSEELAKSKSISDELISGEESTLSKSHTMTQSIGPTSESSDIAKGIELLIAMQRDERIERERKEKEYRDERWRIETEERKERERMREDRRIERETKERKDNEERQRIKEEKEAKEQRIKEERETKERKDNEERQRVNDEKEAKEQRIKEERETKERKDNEERQRVKDEKEAKEQRIKEEKEAKEQRIKEEKEAKEQRIKEEKEAKEQRIKEEKDAKDLKDKEERLKDQLDRDKRRAELEVMWTRDRNERDEREKARDEKEQRERKLRLEEIERDRVFKEAKYLEEKNERLAKESRKDVRLKRATDILKGGFTEQPEDMKLLVISFKSFESSFSIYGIDEDLKVPILLPYLNTRSKQLVLGLDMGATFEQVKSSIMNEYNFTPKMYQSAFVHSFRSLGESSVQFVSRLACSLDLYLESRGISKNYDKLIELLISDRFRDSLDEETRHFVADHEFESWLIPKKMAQLVDSYQSERHSNWNYLRNPKNFISKQGNSMNRSQNSNGYKHQFVKYDKSRMFCTYCKGKGHVKSSCYQLSGNSDRSKGSQRSQGSQGSSHTYKKEARVRKCYVCDSKFHLAPACPDNKKPKKTYNTKRVTINSDVQNLDISIPVEEGNRLPSMNLLQSAGVRNEKDNVEFNPVNYKHDSRINYLSGVHGFIPYVNEGVVDDLKAEGGGVAQLLQVMGVGDNMIGHLDVDVVHQVLQGDKGEVATGLWGGDSSSGYHEDLNRLFDIKDCDTSTKPIHTTNIYTHNKEHIVYVDFVGTVVPMLLDSGTQISVVKNNLIPIDHQNSVSNDTINQINLLGAFGKPVSANIISIEAKLLKDDSSDLRNHNRIILDIALCEELNGDTGLLSIEDFKLLSGISSLVPDVKVMTHSGRVCLNSNTADIGDCVDNDIVSDNDMRHVNSGGEIKSYKNI